MTGLFGFSIDAAALAKPVRINGQTLREACKITQVKSVDLIVEPGANGGIIDFIEAVNEELANNGEITISEGGSQDELIY